MVIGRLWLNKKLARVIGITSVLWRTGVESLVSQRWRNKVTVKGEVVTVGAGECEGLIPSGEEEAHVLFAVGDFHYG